MAAWQRVQLFVLRAAADVVLVTVEAWARELERWRPSRPTRQLPSGSALPDRRTARDATRVRIDAHADAIVIATFSTGHPSHRDDLVTAAVSRVASTHPVVLLVLGARQAPPPPPGVRVVAPGFLPADQVAELLSAADLFLAPLVDGVSNRRTSVMAALQQGVAVVGTHGPLTDSSLAVSEGIALAPAGDAAAFAALAARLADDDGERAALSAAGRALYDERYAPSVLARIVIDACLS
jgi:glycosyltransferase involved in cell wall biosynthesis